MAKTSPTGMRDISTTYQLAYETYDGNVQVRKIGDRLWEVLPRGGAPMYESTKQAAIERAFQISAARLVQEVTKRSGSRNTRAHATRRAPDPTTSSVKLKDRYSGGDIWLTVRDGVVVGAMGTEPKRYLGMTLDQARHVARYSNTGTTKLSTRHKGS